MLRRVALVLLLLAASGLAAIFAAGRFGVTLPWDIASSTAPDPAQKTAAPVSKDREQAPAAKEEQAAKSAETVIDQTVAALGKSDEPKPASGNVEIDISRISPDGSSVFAGRAEPDTYVTVMENGKPAGTVKSDEQGEWSLVTDHRFASTDPTLTFSTSKTPPPAPEPPKTQVAAAAPVPASPTSPSAVASDVMRKFENLVSEAREEAEKNAHDTQQTGKKSEGETPAATAAPATPDAPASSSTTASSSSSAAETSVAANATSTTTEQAAGASTSTTASEKTAAADTDRTTTVIPVPIMFVYNEAVLTPEGERAARLLLEYLTLKRLSAVELTGHADERGTNDYNFDLSRDRLNTVSEILRNGGYTGELKLTPKGKTEPFMGVDRTAYKGEALYQLDRRVELRVTR
jgi:outer membrane protein OmpA-like peptidoglycan-associated protein